MWSERVRFTVFLILGIYLGERISVDDAIVFAIAFLVTLIITKRKIGVSVFLAFLLGVFGYHYAMDSSKQDLYPFDDRYIEVFGKIVDIPEKNADLNSYVADVRLVHYLGEQHEVNERIRITSKEELEFGDSIRAEGFLKPFSDILNDGDFNNKRYFKGKGMHFKMYAEFAEVYGDGFRSFAPDYLVNCLKYKIIKIIQSRYSGDDAAIVQAIFTGNKKAFSEGFEDILYESNTMRLFYPAYIHIAFMFFIIGLFSSYISKKNRDRLMIIALCLYAFFNINRGYIVKCALLVAGLIYSRKEYGFSDYKETLAKLIQIMILLNPLIVYEVGFIFSVMSGIVIYYFRPFLNKNLTVIKNRKLREKVSLWMALNVGMLPVEAYIFNNITLYSFWLNFLYIPLLAAIWILVPVDFIIGGILPVNPASIMIEGILLFMRYIPYVLVKLPWYSILIARPQISLIIIFYFALFIIYRRYVRKRKDDIVALSSCAVIAGLSIVLITGFVSGFDRLKINFVNVGQGDGAVISVPMRETIIIDGGGSSEYSDYDYGENIFVPYLIRNGYTQIDLAIVSHFHSDHCEGVIAAMEKLDVEEVLMPCCMEENEYRRRIEELAKRKGIKISMYDVGAELNYPSGLKMSIVSPDAEDLESEEENDTSLGIRVSYGDFSTLFTGDMTKTVEKNHLGEWGDVDVLKVAHHGSETSNSEEFLNEICPEVAVISVGEGNSYNLPNEDVVRRLENICDYIFRTDLDGDITVVAEKDGKYIIKK